MCREIFLSKRGIFVNVKYPHLVNALYHVKLTSKIMKTHFCLKWHDSDIAPFNRKRQTAPRLVKDVGLIYECWEDICIFRKT